MKLRTIQHPGVEINEYDISTKQVQVYEYEA